MELSGSESEGLVMVRRWVLGAFGVVLIGKAVMTHQWLTGVIGVAIIAYAILMPG